MSSSIFAKNVRQIWGSAGAAWLEQLPSIANVLEKKWQLTNCTPASNLSYNYILLSYQNAKPVALKIGFDRDMIEQEKAALRAYDGRGCIQLLDVCPEHNALLLERAVPGTSLKSLFPDNDDQAVAHTVEVMQQLHKAPIKEAKFKHIQDWLVLLDSPPAAVVNNHHVHKARVLAQELLTSQVAPVLLHGDLHHDNILCVGNTWKAIDPKGVLGEAAYEVGAFIRNPYPLLLQQSNPRLIMHRRLQLFADALALDQERLHAWSYVQAVLSGCWAIQDGQSDPEVAMAEAELLKV